MDVGFSAHLRAWNLNSDRHRHKGQGGSPSVASVIQHRPCETTFLPLWDEPIRDVADCRAGIGSYSNSNADSGRGVCGARAARLVTQAVALFTLANGIADAPPSHAFKRLTSA